MKTRFLQVKHVIFKSLDGMEASIPVEKALSPYGDVLLAYEMNGEALNTEHGAPLRVVAPRRSLLHLQSIYSQILPRPGTHVTCTYPTVAWLK